MFPPLIGIDIGNSGVKLARLLPERGRVDSISRIDWELATNSRPPELNRVSPDTLHPKNPAWLGLVDEYVSKQFAALPRQLTWVLSSVRSDAGSAFCTRAVERGWHVLQPTFQSIPMQINVQFPGRVGIDRLLAAYAASLAVSARPIVVLQAGSAVTIDLVTDRGGSSASAVYQGGAILPGVPMMLRKLGRAADQLPELEADDLVQLPELPGKNTQQAMQCGATGALVGGARYLLSRYREQFGMQVPAVVSGGDGPQLMPFLPEPTIELEQLVLHGLMQFAINHFTVHSIDGVE